MTQLSAKNIAPQSDSIIHSYGDARVVYPMSLLNVSATRSVFLFRSLIALIVFVCQIGIPLA